MLISGRTSIENRPLFTIGLESTRPSLSVVIPTYNESQNISNLITALEDLLRQVNFEIVIVDDNSPDGTKKIVESLNVQYGNIKIFQRSGKLGLGSAVLYGFERADAKILAVMDADMQHPPEILPKMYAKISQGNDLVVASRYVDGGGFGHWSTRRMLISIGATLLAHLLFPSTRRIKDVMSGCFMLRSGAVNGACFSPIGFKVLLEILVKCKFNRVTEVPYIFRNRQNGKSNLSPKEMRSYLVHLYKIFFSRVTAE
jgi:dolichol-phosphate mannosyltransferase